jgi:hypothetical protein
MGTRALLALIALASCKEAKAPAGPWPTGGAQLLSVSSPTKDEDASVLLAKDGTIFVAWFSDRGGNADVYITSTKNGRDWTSPVRVTTHAGGDFYPNLVQDDAGLFHLTWFRWTSLQVGNIIYNTSPDGLTWNTANELMATKALNVDDWVPSLTVRPDGAVLIYFVSKKRSITGTQQNDLYLARKQPGAADFDVVVGALNVNVPNEHEHLPFIARTGSTYTLMWVRHDLTQELPWLNPKSDLYYATSSDGIAWSAPAKFNNDGGNVVNLFPQLYETQEDSWRLLWLSTRNGDAMPFETPVASLGTYPTGVVASSSLPSGYSHRIAPTPVPGRYIAVWVQGAVGSEEVYYRIFER